MCLNDETRAVGSQTTVVELLFYATYGGERGLFKKKMLTVDEKNW